MCAFIQIVPKMNFSVHISVLVKIGYVMAKTTVGTIVMKLYPSVMSYVSFLIYLWDVGFHRGGS